ncbi:MAG TPA: TerC family protein [Chthoniobacter sp.]|jgi:predicted tellurium resistance membrane protein TerC
MTWITDPNIWISLLTLTALEIVLGIDNVIFISIFSDRLPAEKRGRARTVGLSIALVTRILLLCLIFALARFTTVLFVVLGHGFTGRDLVMIGGGIFLLWKSVREIHRSVESDEDGHQAKGGVSFWGVIVQIVLIDIVFSLDSVVTAVGLAQQIEVMIAAVVLAMGVMLLAAHPIGEFVNRHPTIKILALSFLLLVGVVLIADGCGQHIEKGYIYFAMAFSFGVEMLNMRQRAKREAEKSGGS